MPRVRELPFTPEQFLEHSPLCSGRDGKSAGARQDLIQITFPGIRPSMLPHDDGGG
jgi:hypothetical protein